MACISTLSAFNYHYRLGHPTLPVLKFIVPSLCHLSSLECESCQLETHHRVSYLSQVNKWVSKPFDLVRSDVWDPCPITSKLEFKWFASFVNDHCRVTWIYLLKTRFEVFPTLKSFIQK